MQQLPEVKRPRKKRKKKIPKYIQCDWTTLKCKDQIKVGGGPYHVSQLTGVKTYIGHEGEFVVQSVDETGIHAYPLDFYGGHSYIYMGPDVPGIVGTKVAHKVVLKNPEFKG